MAYRCPAKAMLTASQARQTSRSCLSSRLMSESSAVLRRPHVGHRTNLVMLCKAVVASRFDESKVEKLKCKLPYEVLERAFAQQQRELLETKQRLQKSQAQLAQADARAEKAKRVLTKGARRSREAASKARLLEAKLDRLTSQSDVLSLHQTIEDKEEDVQRAQSDAESYKKLFWATEKEKEEEAYQKRRALAAKHEAQKQAQQLEEQRQKDLLWYEETVNTGRVFGQFFFELCIRAMLLPPTPNSTKDSRPQEGEQGSKMVSNELKSGPMS